jgi:acetate CoA/acetoacetate CoA-transferase alpha subunit
MECVSAEEAVALIPDGATIMVGGFMAIGTPEKLMDELVRQGKRNLTLICNDNAMPNVGVGKLVSAGLVKKTISSHIGLNPETQKKMFEKAIDVELVPQGTFVERIRAGGFGLGAVVTPTGVGTQVEEGKRTLELNGKVFLVEMPLRADFALIQAFLCDYLGNLSYALTARNFNSVMAMAADTVIAETEHMVPVGFIQPHAVMTQAPLVDYVVAHEFMS